METIVVTAIVLVTVAVLVIVPAIVVMRNKNVAKKLKMPFRNISEGHFLILHTPGLVIIS